MKTYFAYTRVSTAKQGEHGSSLQEQRAAIEAFASRQALSVLEWFEERETAAKQGRQVFSKLLKRLERGEADGLIIHKIDRSARNLKDWASLGELIDRGVDVQFAHDSVDLHSRGGRLSADIQAVVAADYIRNLRDEVRKGFYGRLKQGLYPLPAPIGYLNIGKGKLKEIDPVRGPLVRQAFELYSTATIGLHGLRKEMAFRGLISPRSKKPLSLCAISTILHNPFYIGLIRVRRTNETFQGNHAPLVSKAVFDRVQAILQGKTVARSVKHDFIFRRMVDCELCGLHLIAERQKGHVYYRCHSDTCRGTSIREEAIDRLIRSNLDFLKFHALETEALDSIIQEIRGNAIADLAKLRSSLTMRIAQCDDRLARLTDAFVDQLIDKELFEHRKSAALLEKRTLADRLNNLSESDTDANRALKNLELGNAAYSGYESAIPSEKRMLVEAVTSNLSVSGKNPAITLKSPFQEIVNWRQSQFGAPHRGTPRTRAKQILAILMADAAATKSEALKKAA